MFDGKDDWVTVRDHDDLDLRDELTLSAWVRQQSRQAHQTVFFKETPDWFTYTLSAGSYIQGNGLTYPAADFSKTGRVASSVTGTPALPVGRWSHLAVTFDGVTKRIFVDGVQTGQGPGVVPAASEGQLRIGSNAVWAAQAFHGAIDEVRMYDKALSVTELKRDRDSSIVPDAEAAYRNGDEDGISEPGQQGAPAAPATARAGEARSATPGDRSGALSTSAAGRSATSSVRAGDARTTAPLRVSAVRSGRLVRVAGRAASAGRLQVRLVRGGRSLDGCARRLAKPGRFSCRLDPERASGRLRVTVTIRTKARPLVRRTVTVQRR